MLAKNEIHKRLEKQKNQEYHWGIQKKQKLLIKTTITSGNKIRNSLCSWSFFVIFYHSTHLIWNYEKIINLLTKNLNHFFIIYSFLLVPLWLRQWRFCFISLTANLLSGGYSGKVSQHIANFLLIPEYRDPSLLRSSQAILRFIYSHIFWMESVWE